MKSANRLEQVFGIKFQQISQACTTNVVEKRNCAIFIPSCSLATLSAYPSFFLFNPCQPSRIKEQGVVDGLGEGGACLFMNRVLCSDGGSFPFHPTIPPLSSSAIFCRQWHHPAFSGTFPSRPCDVTKLWDSTVKM